MATSQSDSDTKDLDEKEREQKARESNPFVADTEGTGEPMTPFVADGDEEDNK